jgi:molecular chaperone HscB
VQHLPERTADVISFLSVVATTGLILGSFQTEHNNQSLTMMMQRMCSLGASVATRVANGGSSSSKANWRSSGLLVDVQCFSVANGSRFCSSTATARLADDDVDESSSSSSRMVDYFRILNVPQRFAVNEAALKTNYLQLMTQLHPDKHATKAALERHATEELAAQVVEAYQTLRHPHLRATHLLKLVDTPMDESIKGDLVGPEFLMEIMEFRETIEDYEEANRTTRGKSTLQHLMDQAQEEMGLLCTKLDHAFEAKDYDTALVLSAQLQYWHRIEETLYDKL